MTLEERIKLINAGYTKEEIAGMEEVKETKPEPEAKPEPEKKESGPDFSALITEAVAKAVAAAMVKPEPEKEEKKEEKKEPEKAQDDEVIKKLVSDQLKAFFQPSIKIDPVTDISDISKRFFEISINKKEGE